ncbi:Membrane-bound lytic murein transglycosylase B precursor [Tatumella ptyseos]|uniref:Membrane-bound lytic murein transglycosylase B n=1 Tax=Tatumella ptyseos TaxID=82987 RepID=A0A2X5NIE6_9GAMM|nr:Membrane-bound lytic murein transglycosylase B precursor [Tatumella ptyseos]
MRYKIALLPLFALLAACSSKPQGASGSSPQEGFLRPPGAGQGMLSADFLGQPQTEAFITMMVKKHGFDRRQLESWLGQARRLDYVLRLMDRQAPNVAPAVGPNGAWLRYRKNFITRAMSKTEWLSGINIRPNFSKLSRNTVYLPKLLSALSGLKPVGAG